MMSPATSKGTSSDFPNDPFRLFCLFLSRKLLYVAAGGLWTGGGPAKIQYRTTFTCRKRGAEGSSDLSTERNSLPLQEIRICTEKRGKECFSNLCNFPPSSSWGGNFQPLYSHPTLVSLPRHISRFPRRPPRVIRWREKIFLNNRRRRRTAALP